MIDPLRRVATLLMVAMICAPVFGQSKKAAQEEDPVDAFKKVIAEASQPASWSYVYLDRQEAKWAKSYVMISDVKYDVRKTDSLISPVIGIVEFSSRMPQSLLFDTQAEAEASTQPAPDEFVPSFGFVANYTYNKGAWTLQKITYRSNRPNSIIGPQEATRDYIIQNATDGTVNRIMMRWVR